VFVGYVHVPLKSTLGVSDTFCTQETRMRSTFSEARC
jgi:hypothetical protein